MTDVIFFAGPVLVKSEFKAIDWYGRDVRIIPITGAGSDYFSTLAEALRDRDGRILPNLIQKYARGIAIDNIALAAYSAGHGLLNKILDVDADRADIDAVVLSDATFNAFNTPAKRGYVKAGIDAARGEMLFVVTTANTSNGTHMTGRDSFQLVWDAVAQERGNRGHDTTPRPPAPPASGGWHKQGSLFFWGNYSTDTVNDFSHEQHHDLAPEIWQAYLAPYFAGKLTSWWLWALAGGVAGAGAAALLWRWAKR